MAGGIVGMHFVLDAIAFDEAEYGGIMEAGLS
jgi:hypothetical protein